MITPTAENKLLHPLVKNKGLYYMHNFTRQGIPARDLTAEEVEIYGGKLYLLATGLYSGKELDE